MICWKLRSMRFFLSAHQTLHFRRRPPGSLPFAVKSAAKRQLSLRYGFKMEKKFVWTAFTAATAI